MNRLELQFLDTSLERRNADRLAERRRARRLRLLLATTGVVAVVALIAGALALRAQRRADDQAATAQANAADAADARDEAEVARDEAEQVAFDAETARLAATARELSTTDPRAAALIALAAYDRDQSPDTLGALQTVLVNAGPVISWMGPGRSYLDVELMDGNLAAGLRVDGVDLFDRHTGDLLDSVEADVGAPIDYDWARKARSASAGSLLAIAEGVTIRVFDTTSGRLDEQMSFTLPDAAVSISLTENMVAATSNLGAVQAWMLAGDRVWTCANRCPTSHRSTRSRKPGR